MEYSEPILYQNQSKIESTIIKDSDIFKAIGFSNYTQLNRKYPYLFKYFPECDSITNEYGFIPSKHLIHTSSDPVVIKKDIIKTMYYEKWFSSNSDLVLLNKEKDTRPGTDVEYNSSYVILFYLVFFIVLTLIVFALIKGGRKNLTKN